MTIEEMTQEITEEITDEVTDANEGATDKPDLFAAIRALQRQKQPMTYDQIHRELQLIAQARQEIEDQKATLLGHYSDHLAIVRHQDESPIRDGNPYLFEDSATTESEYRFAQYGLKLLYLDSQERQLKADLPRAFQTVKMQEWMALCKELDNLDAARQKAADEETLALSRRGPGTTDKREKAEMARRKAYRRWNEHKDEMTATIQDWQAEFRMMGAKLDTRPFVREALRHGLELK